MENKMLNYSKKFEFDQAAGVKIQTGKLETVKKIMQAIEKDLNSPAIDEYHSAAIAVQVLYNYLEQGGKFHNDCKELLNQIKEHFEESGKTTTH